MAELVDTNSATAKASDILQDKTAYVKSGLVAGTIPTQAGGEIIPGTASKTVVERGKYMTGDIVMAGDANLKPENITKGVTIFGVKGTWEGEPPPPGLPEGFYDINAKPEHEDDGKVFGSGVASQGTTITVTAEEEWYSTFENWKENGEVISGEKDYRFNVSSDRNLIATYKTLPAYTISATVEPEEAGDVSGAGKYHETESVTLTASENLGYDFEEWKENNSSISSEKEYEFTAERDRNLVANFSGPTTYTISASVEPVGGGTVLGTGDYLKRATVELVAVKNENYEFSGWYIGSTLVSTSSTLSFQALLSRKIIAKFRLKERIGSKAVGDIVLLNVDGVATEFIVINQGRPSTAYDSSCDGTWLLMKDCYGPHVYNNPNASEYATSQINEYINNDFYNALDANVRDIVKTVKIPYTLGSSYKSGANGLQTKIFLLSVKEINGSGLSGVNTEGATLEYFKSAKNADRIAYYQGKAVYWWTRTQYTGTDDTGAAAVWSIGEIRVTIGTSANHYVRPAMIIDSNAMI